MRKKTNKKASEGVPENSLLILNFNVMNSALNTREKVSTMLFNLPYYSVARYYIMDAKHPSLNFDEESEKFKQRLIDLNLSKSTIDAAMHPEDGSCALEYLSYSQIYYIIYGEHLITNL